MADISDNLSMDGNSNTLIILFSYHHNNTEKIARAIAKVLDARIVNPQQADPRDLQDYDIIGFGAGIDSGRHYKPLLDFANEIQQVDNKHAFIFSTAGVTGEKKLAKDHSALRGKLEAKGYRIMDEFQCKGFNTNSFLKHFGGINKGRPNADDLKRAEEFARNLKWRRSSTDQAHQQ
jgi:flavodoxin